MKDSRTENEKKPETSHRLEPSHHSVSRDGLQLLQRLVKDPKLTHARRKVILNETLVRVKEQIGTPLVLASLNGFKEVVEILLKHELVDVEQTCTVYLEEGGRAEGVTPLWAAAYSGHVGIVKLLLQSGADANHGTHTNSSPLRTSCFRGWKNVVVCLIESGADVNGVNSQGSSCLMAAAYNGYKDLITHLISKNVCLDSKDRKGNTALHYSAEKGQLSAVKILMKFGATMLQNDEGMTPLKLACNACHDEVMKYFVLRRQTSRYEIIEALELLGATYANHPEKSNCDKAFKLLMTAMQHRYHDPDSDVLHKFVRPPVKAYGYRFECQTPEELEAIKDNSNAIHMEGLIVRERLLRARNSSVPLHIRYRGACLADKGNFEEALELWKYAAKLDQRNEHSACEQLMRAGQLIVRMVLADQPPSFGQVEELFSMLLHDMEKLYSDEAKSLKLQLETRTIFEKSQLAVLYYLAIVLQLDLARKEERRCMKLIKKFLALEQVLNDGGHDTLLHLSVCDDTLDHDKDLQRICKFPSVEVARLLIEAGADANATNHKGSTPLHVIASFATEDPDSKRTSTSSAQMEIIQDLLAAGSRREASNQDHMTPADYAQLQEVKTMISQFSIDDDSDDPFDIHI